MRIRGTRVRFNPTRSFLLISGCVGLAGAIVEMPGWGILLYFGVTVGVCLLQTLIKPTWRNAIFSPAPDSN